MWPLPETAMGALCNCLADALPYTHYVIRSSPLCGVKVLHPAQYDLTRQPLTVTAKKKQGKKRRYRGCLAHEVIGVFYSIVANRRQPYHAAARAGGVDEIN